MKKLGVVLALIAGMLVSAMSADAGLAMPHEGSSYRMSRRGAAGKIAVRAGRRHFPENAEVSLVRTHAESARRKIKDGLKKRRGVLAMYDISIRAGGKKWQPDAGDPVHVTVDLEEPVAATSSSLAVAHLADDGTVEELPASRYGFTYNADRTAVTAFWFDATGFSVYAIVDAEGELVTPRRFYHFYGHSTDDRATPYIYHDQAGDPVNVQIVKDGDMLKEPPVPLDILNDNGEVVSMFEGWYVVSNSVRAANAVESKLDPTNEVFEFVWPVGVTDMRLAFTNAVSVTETSDWDYFVVPLYENARFLQFNENAETEQGVGARIIRRKLVAINDETGVATLRVSDVEAALKNSRNEYFCGWRYMASDGQYTNLLVYSELGKPQDQYITVDDALFAANGGTIIPLYPYYVSAHFLHFDANARSVDFVGSIFVRSTSNFSQVEVSGNRKGYDFAGWCAGTKDEAGNVTLWERVTDAQGNFIPDKTITNETGAVIFYTDASGNIRLNEDVTLFGSWVANSSAPYRVIVWQQRVTDAKDAADEDKQYYYVTHYTSTNVASTTSISDALFKNFTGTRADKASIAGKDLSALSGLATDNAANENFTGFHYGRYECDDATVASDGSTVINLYYDRDLITLRFCLYDSNQTETTYSTTTSTSGDIYGTDDGENYFAVYYDNGQWYRTRTSVPSYSYSTQHTGDRYRKSGNSYTKVSSSDNSGTQYRKSGNSYYEIFYNEADGKWYRNRTETTTYAYSDSYSGYRYTVSTSHWIVNQTMSGLYGSTLEANGYTWPEERAWKDGYSGSSSDGTSISFLDAFLPTSGGDETFYSSAASSSSGAVIYFYKEALDGSWTLANEYHSGSSSVNFNISDKYNGFEAYQYSKSGGSWTSVGTYNANTGYYGSQVSSVSDKLEIRFKRKQYELIYKYIDDDGNGDEHTVYDTGKTVLYEAPLAGYDYAYTNSILDWSECNITNRTFEGWYEDASLTKKFDFSATMPDGTKFLYANWAPKKHRVIVDPNGGELPENGSTWFYVNPAKEETIKEYTLTRNYRLDLHNGTYYYHYDQWDPVNDKHTDQYIPANSNATRKAYYTTNVLEATDNEYSNPENRYTYDPGAYAFMGWYQVLEDGLLATDPFSFDEPPTGPVTIRALWRRLGIYTLKYESIDPDAQRPLETIYDPERHSTGNIEDGYIADAETTLAKAPANYNKNEWLWEGWQVVDTYNNNIPMTGIRSPGDIYIVKPAHADANNVIHLRAVYKPIGDGTSRHIPPVTDLILDSNENAGLAANASVASVEGRVGTYTDGTAATVSGLNQGVWFVGAQNNLSVNLADYRTAFAHDYGYFLLGWDPMRTVDSMIPAHYANETIGIDKTDDDENILYAVWEPQIYIEFTNDTDDVIHDITLYIPSWVNGELFRVNAVTGEYGREAFSAFSDGAATFDLGAHETLRLVLPDAANKDFAVFGNSPYAEGTKLVITRVEPQVDGQEAIPDKVVNAYAGEYYQVAGTMKVSPTPVQVRFTKSTYPTTTTVPVRYFLHDKNGTVTEITQYDAAYWRSQNFRTTLTAGSAVGDIAGMLRTDTSGEGVHELLSDNVRTNYGHTTIGIGVASAAITADHATLHENEYRSITQEGASGGPYFKFYHEELDWSRYSQVWNGYDDPAVYVVFYKRTPVHVTVGKNVVGSEEDKFRTFDFTAQIAQRSTNLEYTVVTTYQQTRTLTVTKSSNSTPKASEWPDTPWSDPVAVSTNASSATASSDQTPDLFEPRDPEHFSLADSARHPVTIYYDSSETNVGEPVQSSANVTDGNVTSTTSGSIFNRKYTFTKTQTSTWTQTVTYLVTYQYEVATIQEAETNAFALTGIGGGGDSCKGTGNLAARTYTISSLGERDARGFFTYTSLDTAIFTNTRKTGSLTVTKTVVDGEAGDTFPFIVTLGETVVNKDSYTPPAGVHLGPYGKVFSFSLANGGSVTLPGLPAGASYKVEEGTHDKYVATVPANAEGTVAAGSVSVGFVNTHKTALSITIHDRDEYFTGDELYGWDISCVTGAVASVVSNEAYEVTGLKNGHVMTVEHHVAAHGRAVGSYVGHFENARVTVHDAGGNDVTGEYIVTTTAGSLTVNGMPIVVTVTGNHETRTYNGEEQSCSGYTYVIENGLTGEVVTNDNIYIAIDHNYQTAWRTFVGRSDMHLQPSHVVVTVPDGMTVSEIVVAENGWLEIAPAPVTVKADDKAKILNRPDPALTAAVTGLLGSDTVAYTLSRAAGETPGEYAITPSGEAAQGNYAVTYEPGTLTIAELELIQRSTGSGVSVSVPVTDEMVEALGFDSTSELSAEDVGEAMNKVDPNGLRHWENLVSGTATNSLLLSTAVDATSTNMTFRLSEDHVLPENLGYHVLHELRKHNGSGWERICEISDKVVPTFPLDSDDATGYYRIFMLLIPKTHLAITNEIPTTNVVGVLRIASTARHTMAAVPFVELPRDPALNEPVKVQEYVGNGFVKDGDIIRLREDDTFKVWGMDDGAFTPYTFVRRDGETSEVPGAEDCPLAPGQSVWVTRSDYSKPFTIIGQFTGEPVEVTIGASSLDELGGTVPGSTMVTNSRLEPLKVNDINWGDNPVGGTSGDKLEVPTSSDDGHTTWLIWNPSQKKWGTNQMKLNGRRYVNTFVPSEIEIPAGMGFWYHRANGSAFTVQIKGAINLD